MDKLSLVQKTLKCVKPISPKSSKQRARRRTQSDCEDFISRVNGTKTCWPALMLASAVIAGSIVLLISFALSNGAG